jgi:very-short-patch-repair endonuclease
VLFLAKQVVIVGDEQQVSPTSIGQRVDQEKALIEQHLSEIPNRELYDGRASIYDFGQQAFGGLVQLREHFRCVPEIISFSNSLAYNGNIVPLREAVGVTRRPHVVEYKVDGVRKRYTNNEEAEFIVSAILSACEIDEYSDATFGVISMLRDEQGRLIDDMLRNLMDPEEFATRRILVGSPPQFQGDERDVIFLSLVNSTDDGPQRLERSDDYKKRLNVAASRARDQMWVVHSLDPSTDLKSDDLRLRLIQHAKNPNSHEIKSAAIRQKTRSEFENRVGDDLIRRGYNIEADYAVGTYFLDFVVFGADNRRIAIECDGDEFHTEMNLNEDMARQALLERMNWTFIRLRGTDYFRRPEEVMDRVFKRLREHGIEPNTVDDMNPDDRVTDVQERLLSGAARIRAEWSENILEELSQTQYQPTDDISSIVESDESPAILPPNDAGSSVILSSDEFKNHPAGLPTYNADLSVTSNSQNASSDSSNSNISMYEDAVQEARNMKVANHPSNEAPETLRRMIEMIVQIEGPVHHDVIMDRVRTAYDLGRLQGRTRMEVSGQLGPMLIADRLRASNDFYSLYQNETDHHDVQARTVGGRRVVHISESELLAIVGATIGSSTDGSLTVDFIISRLKTALEIRRLTSKVGEILTAIARKYIDSLATVTDRVDSPDFRNRVDLFENALVRIGYDPSIDISHRIEFINAVAVPELTNEGAINSLNAIIQTVSSDPTVQDSIKINLFTDLKWLTDR